MARTWTYGGNLSSARYGISGCGLQTAGLAIGGYGGTYVDTDEYNGVSWAVGGNLNTWKYYAAACGVQTAALSFGGIGPVMYIDVTEEYNGTIWSAGGNLLNGRRYLAGAGLQTAGLCIGGDDGSRLATTEEYNGTIWSAGGNLAVAKSALGACGSWNAALAFAGYTGAYSVTTEEYNGTIWSAGGPLALGRSLPAGGGSQSAAFCCGGYTSPVTVTTEEYNGTIWSAGGNLNTGRATAGGCGTLLAGLCFGGYGPLMSTEEYAEGAPVSGYSLVRSKCFLKSYTVRSKVSLNEPPLTDKIPSFWFLKSISGPDDDEEAPTLHKAPFKGVTSSFNILFGGSSQHYHSFGFDEDTDAYCSWGTYVYQHEKCWAYDQHNNHLAILAKNQKAIHIYDLSSGVEDIIYSLQADEFENAVGLAFSDGRVDVFTPTVQMSGTVPGYYFLFDLARRESGAYLPYLYSFNIDGTPVDGPVLYSKAAVGSQVVFDQAFGVSSDVALEEAFSVPVESRLEFGEDRYAKSRTLLGDGYFLKSLVSLDFTDCVGSGCFLMIGDLEGCESKCALNGLNSSEQVRSKAALADPYQWGLQSRVTAIGDYLLIGIMSNIYGGSIEDTNAAFYLILFNRKTFKCIWSKPLKVSRVDGTTLYDGWLWEDIKTKDGFTHIFTEGKFEIELFDCFGAPRIALARFGKLNPPYTHGTVWEEYDINLENPCNINLIDVAGSLNILYPTGFVFKSRDPYDLPIKTGEPKKDYLCYTLRGETDFSNEGVLELFQRDQADGYYTFAGSAAYDDFSWLVAFLTEASCRFLKSEVALNIDYSYLRSKASLFLPDPFIGTSGLWGEVTLQESLIKIIQSKTAIEDSNLLQSKVFMDDFLIRSSVDFIDNKGLGFYARYVVGQPSLSYKGECPGSGDCTPVLSIIRIGGDEKAYHSRCCVHWGVPAGHIQPSLWCRPAIVGNYIYYIVKQLLYNWDNPPPWYIPHYFLWKTNVNTYMGTHQLPIKLYHEATGSFPDADVWSVDYLIEFENEPFSSLGLPFIYLDGRFMYIAMSGSVHGIACILFDLSRQEFFPLSYILPEYTKIVSIDTDGTYLYLLGYKSDIEGLWLVKLNTVFTVLDELVLFKGRLHTGGSYEAYNAQFSFWDSVNNQFIIGIAPVAGRHTVTDYGYGAIVYSPVDGSIKWWKNFYPTGLAVHTMPGLDTTYFQRKRDDTIGMYTKYGDYRGADLDITDLGGGRPFEMIKAYTREVWIETFMQSKTMLVEAIKEQDDFIPDIPGPTQVPREQRFEA